MTALVMVVTSAVAWRVSGTIAYDEAIRRAEHHSQAVAWSIVAPLVTRDLVMGDPAAFRALDTEMRQRLNDRTMVRVKLWDVDGRIIYSDEPRLVGRRFPLGAAERNLLRTRGVMAGLSDTDAAENVYEQPLGDHIIEVYIGLRGSDGGRYLFETYIPSEVIQELNGRVFARMLPTVLGSVGAAMFLLLLVVVVNDRRVRRLALARGTWTAAQDAVTASERRRLARQLHDDVIQDIAGLGYALASARSHLQRTDERTRSVLETADQIVHRSLIKLRELLSELYPSADASSDLTAQLEALAEPLRARGVSVSAGVQPDLVLAPPVRAALYRVAREALRNVDKHAGARHVDVTVRQVDHAVELRVTDDGAGLAADALTSPRRGHLGVTMLADEVAELGGTLRLTSRPEGGCEVFAELPAAVPAPAGRP